VDHEADRPSPATYPYYQAVTRGEWLRQILSAPAGSDGGTVADELRVRQIELRCEPGRSLLDGCGMTIAQVAFRKHASDGIPLVGLYMNRTQVRSTSADFLLDPIFIRRSPQPVVSGSSSEPGRPALSESSVPSDPLSGAFLVGSYCIEEELILRRSFDFPNGVQVGDLIAFPNTGGYLMHILESASHQLPLAANLVATPGDSKLGIPEHWVLDGIDR
jgi:diaminopimelate decarboxylase